MKLATVKLATVLLSLAGTSTLLHATPILGGYCDGVGTLAEFIALGETGCYLTHGERIYDISASLPGGTDPATVMIADAMTTKYSEATGYLFQPYAVLTIHYQSPSWGVTGDWYQFQDAQTSYPFDPTLTVHPFQLEGYNAQGTITLTATIPDAHLGFRLTQVAPEPGAFLPLLAGLLIMIARYGVLNSSSR